MKKGHLTESEVAELCAQPSKREEVCGIDKGTYLSQGINQLEKLRTEIEEKLSEVEFILRDMGENIPEFRGMKDRVEAYWLSAIKGMLRDSGSMVNMDETMSEIQEALTDYVNQQEQK